MAKGERQRVNGKRWFFALCLSPFAFFISVIRGPLLKLILIFIDNITYASDGADNGRIEFLSQMVDMNFDGIAFYIRIP